MPHVTLGSSAACTKCCVPSRILIYSVDNTDHKAGKFCPDFELEHWQVVRRKNFMPINHLWACQDWVNIISQWNSPWTKRVKITRRAKFIWINCSLSQEKLVSPSFISPSYSATYKGSLTPAVWVWAAMASSVTLFKLSAPALPEWPCVPQNDPPLPMVLWGWRWHHALSRSTIIPFTSVPYHLWVSTHTICSHKPSTCFFIWPNPGQPGRKHLRFYFSRSHT